jgi:hypothetical protein
LKIEGAMGRCSDERGKLLLLLALVDYNRGVGVGGLNVVGLGLLLSLLLLIYLHLGLLLRVGCLRYLTVLVNQLKSLLLWAQLEIRIAN